MELRRVSLSFYSAGARRKRRDGSGWLRRPNQGLGLLEVFASAISPPPPRPSLLGLAPCSSVDPGAVWLPPTELGTSSRRT